MRMLTKTPLTATKNNFMLRAMDSCLSVSKDYIVCTELHLNSAILHSISKCFKWDTAKHITAFQWISAEYVAGLRNNSVALLGLQSVEHRLCTVLTFDEVPLASSRPLCVSHNKSTNQLFQNTFFLFLKKRSWVKVLSIQCFKDRQTQMLNIPQIH